LALISNSSIRSAKQCPTFSALRGQKAIRHRLVLSDTPVTLISAPSTESAEHCQTFSVLPDYETCDGSLVPYDAQLSLITNPWPRSVQRRQISGALTHPLASHAEYSLSTSHGGVCLHVFKMRQNDFLTLLKYLMGLSLELQRPAFHSKVLESQKGFSMSPDLNLTKCMDSWDRWYEDSFWVEHATGTAIE
jgi:hypothetical protein